MTISKSKIINLVEKYNDNKNVQYNIYKIILEKCPNSIKKNNDKIDIEMSKIDDKTVGLIEKYIINFEKTKEYEKKREIELKAYTTEIANTKKNVKVIDMKSVPEIDNEIENKLKMQWRKRWGDDYKGDTNNMYDDHVKRLRTSRKQSKKWEQYLKITKNIREKGTTLRATDGNFEGEDTHAYKNKDIDELNDILDSMELNDYEEERIDIEDEQEDDPENELDNKDINELSSKERNKLLFGDSESEDSDIES